MLFFKVIFKTLWPTVYRKHKVDPVSFNLLAVLSSETHKNILSKNNPPRNKKEGNNARE